jgi:superfamily II DNA or RNA helicase
VPAYRFSWDAFDDATVTALAETVGYCGSGPDVRAWLGSHVKRPNDDFIQKTKDTIERHWLPKYPAGSIVERLLEAGIGPMGSPKTQAEHVAYIRRCRNSSTLRRLLAEALIRYGDVDRGTDVDVGLPTDTVRRFAIVRPSEQPADPRRPHSYQLEAWDRLSAHLAESESTGRFRGLLVMPTGSGKTYTAAHWLLRTIVARGGKVLWLAHRQELLNQAAASFCRLARIVPTRERLRVRIVSRDHCATSQIDPGDDILVCSIGSLARRPDITKMLLDDPEERFVVIDEAHHAPMKSYRDIIEELAKRPRGNLLGLTATPTRTVERERPILGKLFDGRVLLDVPIKDLIERKILSRPIPVRVETDANVEQGITEADLDHLTQFNELSEEWLDRIAHLSARNQIIVQHYITNRARYGKTLMFAINVPHAALLAEELKRRDVSADYVASYRPDGTESNNAEVIQSFREPGGLEVLVNVQILTEGVDLPAVEAVFLTRPTSSEILLRQMIGRGMRGPAAGGTDKVYLVSFEDHWEQFREWQGQLSLVPDIVGAAGGEEGKPPPSVSTPAGIAEALPWELIRAYAAQIASSGRGYEANVFEAVHHGWFVLERVVDGQDVGQHIAVYEHQRPSWNALLAHLSAMGSAELAGLSEAAEFDQFFYDCDSPKPALHEVRQMLEHFRAGGERPEYHAYPERSLCDPYNVASEIWTADLGERKKGELLEQRHTALARAIYPTLREYRSAVEDALYELAHPEDANRNVLGIPVFEPRPEDQLTAGPGQCHELERLMPEVLAVGAKLLGLASLPHEGPVEWSRRLIKGWYGKANWEPDARPGHGKIRINCLLDSPGIGREVIQFLLWHEYLHLHLLGGHTPQFRELERKWPGMIEADRVLDNLNERFGVQYW